MRYLGLIAKIAFVCNLFFLGCILLQRFASVGGSLMVSFVAIMGLVMGMGIVNPVANIVTFVAWLQRSKLPDNVPVWLAIANLFCLIIQFTYVLHTWS